MPIQKVNRKWKYFDYSRAVHYITLDHGHSLVGKGENLSRYIGEYSARKKVVTSEEAESRLVSIVKNGLIANPRPYAHEIIDIRKDSVFFFPYYEGCDADKDAYHVRVNILELINDGFEVHSGAKDFIDRLGAVIDDFFIRMRKEAWVMAQKKQKIKFKTFEDYVHGCYCYDLRMIDSSDDLISGAELCSTFDSTFGLCSFGETFSPYFPEIIVKGDIPLKYISVSM